jgi:hypothetical protein
MRMLSSIASSRLLPVQGPKRGTARGLLWHSDGLPGGVGWFHEGHTMRSVAAYWKSWLYFNRRTEKVSPEGEKDPHR